MKYYLRRLFVCSWVSKLIPAYVAGKLPKIIHWIIRRHISKCQNCQEAEHNERLIRVNLETYVRETRLEKARLLLKKCQDEENTQRR